VDPHWEWGHHRQEQKGHSRPQMALQKEAGLVVVGLVVVALQVVALQVVALEGEALEGEALEGEALEGELRCSVLD